MPGIPFSHRRCRILRPSDVREVARVSTRLLVAAALGGLLGYERELKRKAAGLRTHMLVALGAALFVLVPLQAGVPKEDVSRVMQGIVTGIGFLGAGTILKGSSVEDVKGLTTAAGIWLTAALALRQAWARSHRRAQLAAGARRVPYHADPRAPRGPACRQTSPCGALGHCRTKSRPPQS